MHSYKAVNFDRKSWRYLFYTESLIEKRDGKFHTEGQLIRFRP